MLNLLPANELLLQCLRTGIDENNSQRIQSLIRKDIDWVHLVQMATLHKVAPLLYQKLSPHFQADIPEQVLNELRNSYLSNLNLNAFLTRELFRILELLREAGIATIAFKGPVLAFSIYGDLGLRGFQDLDILIFREHMAQAKTLLHNAGYRLLLPVPPKQEAFFLHFHFEHAFKRQDGKVMIDLHWAPSPPYHSFTMDVRQLWQRSRNVALEGQPIRTLAPEDQFLILCEHGCKHRWGRLSWIVDVAGLLAVDPPLNLLETIERSKKIGSRRMVTLALYLAADLLQIRLPEEILELIIQDDRIKTLASYVYQQLFREGELVAQGFGPDADAFYLKTMLRRKDEVMPFVADLLIPTSLELNLFSLPASFFFLYILSRPARLAAKYATNLLKRLI